MRGNRASTPAWGVWTGHVNPPEGEDGIGVCWVWLKVGLLPRHLAVGDR